VNESVTAATGRDRRIPTAVFVSGAGTNLQHVIDLAAGGVLPLDLRLVVSNMREAFAVERASRASIPALIAPFERHLESRAAYGARLAANVRARGIELVLLLGWMHVLDAAFVNAGFAGILNLHPAFLPDDPRADDVALPDGNVIPVFRGPHALRDALAFGARITGATLIQITADVDRGPVLARRTCPLLPGDDEKKALERLHDVEREVVAEGVSAWLTAAAYL
jgi:phosphoribosylglycinamide formyltransferase-1